jgi:hypothetical protein
MSPELSCASITLHGVGRALILSLIVLSSVADAARKVGLPQIPEEPVVDPEAKPTHFWYNTELGESSWEDPLPIRHEDDEVACHFPQHPLQLRQGRVSFHTRGI